MSYVVLALSASVVWGVCDFVGALQARTAPVATVVAALHGAGALGLVGVIVTAGVAVPGGQSLAVAALGGVTLAVGGALFYGALSVGDLSVVVPLAATAATVPLLVGALGGDVLSAGQVAGAVLALLGVMFVAREPAKQRGRVVTGAAMALASAVFIGGYLVAMDAAGDAGVIGAVAISRIVSASLLIAWVVLRRRAAALPREKAVVIAAIGVLDVVGNVMFVAAATRGPLSLVAVLASMYPVVTLALGVACLHERPTSARGLGVIATLSGVALILGG